MGVGLLRVHTCEGKGALATVLWGSFCHSDARIMGGLASPGLDGSGSWMLRDRYAKGRLHMETTRTKNPGASNVMVRLATLVAQPRAQGWTNSAPPGGRAAAQGVWEGAPCP